MNDLNDIKKQKLLHVVKLIAYRGGISEMIHLSSKELAKILGTTQQTASNRLISCTHLGLIERRLTSRGQYVRVASRGVKLLQQEYADYIRIFNESRGLCVRGKVVSGLGEGRYYIAQEGYKKQFEKKLSISPYPGTFNVKLPTDELHKIELLRNAKGITIDGFKAEERTFGEVKAFHASIHASFKDAVKDSVKGNIKDIKCAVIIPMRSHHTDVIEIISEQNLRRALEVKDGNDVEILIKF